MGWQGLFVTGTDTGVGKTFITTAIVRRLRELSWRVGAYKPAVSGALFTPAGPVWQDVQDLSTALGDVFPVDRISPQRFTAPLAPPVSARIESRQVDSQLLRTGVDWWRERADVLIVEGAGGLLSPLTETESVAALARDLGFPLLIVARAGLGTINHTLLTVEAAEQRGLQIAGIVLNQTTPEDRTDDSCATNAAEIASRTSVPILAVFPFCGRSDLLSDVAFNKIHWQDLIGFIPPLRAGDVRDGHANPS